MEHESLSNRQNSAKSLIELNLNAQLCLMFCILKNYDLKLKTTLDNYYQTSMNQYLLNKNFQSTLR